jgi:hypothetical protein
MRIFTLCLCLLLFTFSFAQTKGDPIGLGNGQDGSVTINTFNTIINSYSQLTSNVNAGSKTLNVSTTAGFTANSLVMIIQMSGHALPASGNQGPFTLTSTDVGRFELIRISSVGAGTITLVDGVRRGFPALLTQVVKVPEYTNFTLNATGSVISQIWNGTTGGIIAFLATGTVTINNTLSATIDAGFRGGIPVQDVSGSTNCSGIDEASPQGGRKGESLVPSQFGTASGRGNLLNGGGGGVCVSAGGGGGGNAGKGGKGGMAIDGRDVGGMGGGNLTYNPTTNLLLGGGGGAGHITDLNVVPGASGGGIIFIRANSITGTGSIEAQGASANFTDDLGGTAGGPGGGAGGTIYIRTVGAINLPGTGVNTVIAGGGNGGLQNQAGVAPGGGGGGGQILLQGSAVNVLSDVIGGFAGINPDGGAYLNTDGEAGIITVFPGGLVIPTSPTVSSPANGATTGLRPVISGTGPANTTINIYVDDIPLGSAMTTGAGAYNFTPGSDLSVGAHVLRTTAEMDAIESPYSASVSFTASGTLPVVLEYFTAKSAGKDNHIQWKIAEQQNHAFFTLYYSSDNVSWTKLRDFNQSVHAKMYQYTHRPVDAHQHLYKLTQTDFDGRTKELGIRKVAGKSNVANAFVVSSANTQELITVRFNNEPAVKQVQLLSADGRVLFEHKSANNAVQIPLKGFSKGTYFIRVTFGGAQAIQPYVHFQ